MQTSKGKDGRYRSLHHDDPIGMFQFSLRLPPLQHSGNSRWRQCVPCQHQAAHFHPNVSQKIEKMDDNPSAAAGLGTAHWVTAFSIIVSVFVCHWFFGNGVWIYGALVFTGCLSHIKKVGTYYRLAALVIPFFLLMLSKRLYFCDFQTLYTYPGFGKLVKPQMDLEKTFAVDCEYYFGNYNKVINIVEKRKIQTNT